MKRIACLISLMLLSGVASAVEPNACANGLFPSFEHIQYAKVVGNKRGRAYFYRNYGGCPEKPSCKKKTYIVKEDRALFAELSDPHWACVWYFGKKREYVGLTERENLKLLPEKEPGRREWAGTWESSAGGSEIRIKVGDKDTLSVSGTASWEGRPVDGKYPVVHTGEIEGEGVPAGRTLTIGNPEAKYDCVVKFQLVHRNLIVSDNGNCGGVNVSFTDIYRRHR